MAIWEQGTPAVEGDVSFGARIDIDGSGPVWVKVLGPQYRQDDGDEYCNVGFGAHIIVPADYFEG